MNQGVRHSDDGWISQGAILLRAAAALFAVILAGTVVFWHLEPDWSFQKALFFVIITITTVGYGDEGIDENGRWVAMALMLCGIGVATWSVSQFVQAGVSYQLAWRRRMQNSINKLNNHFIICGYGRVGRSVCDQLAQDNRPFVVIELNAERVREVRDHGFHVINGCGSEDDALIRAGLHRAKGVVACASSDAENMMIVFSVRGMHESALIVARANEPAAVLKLQRAGATRVIAPAIHAGKDIATYLANPTFADFLNQTTNAGIGFRLSECLVGEGSGWVGRSVIDIGHEHPQLIFVAIKHADGRTCIRPSGDEVIHENDILALAGDDDTLTSAFQETAGDDPYARVA